MATAPALSDYTPERQRPQTRAELVAEAERVITPASVAEQRRLYGSSIGNYTPEQLRKAHVAMFTTPAMRAEADAARRAEFGPLWKDVHPRGSL